MASAPRQPGIPARNRAEKAREPLNRAGCYVAIPCDAFARVGPDARSPLHRVSVHGLTSPVRLRGGPADVETQWPAEPKVLDGNRGLRGAHES
jgi:hypothetical protein